MSQKCHRDSSEKNQTSVTLTIVIDAKSHNTVLARRDKRTFACATGTGAWGIDDEVDGSDMNDDCVDITNKKISGIAP
jgi:hypothetical protein